MAMAAAGATNLDAAAYLAELKEDANLGPKLAFRNE